MSNRTALIAIAGTVLAVALGGRAVIFGEADRVRQSGPDIERLKRTNQEAQEALNKL